MSARSNTPLRHRLIGAFLLVSVPPMLVTAYAAAGLISISFERNVGEWLGETSQFIRSQIDQMTLESERSAEVLAKRLVLPPEIGPPDITARLRAASGLLIANGLDVVVLFDANRQLAFSTAPGIQMDPQPLGKMRGIFTAAYQGKTLLLGGASIDIGAGDARRTLFIGAWLEDEYFDSPKVATSLNLQVFRRQGTDFSPILKGEASLTYPPPSREMVTRLQASDDPVIADVEDQAVYQAVYAGLKDVEGRLVGAAYVGLSASENFFERIGLWQLLLGIFFFGSAISIGAGLWVSGLLVRPLDALARGVRAIAAGDYRMRVSASGGAEISELAGRFNDMAAELERLRQVEIDMRRQEKLSALGEAAMVIAHEVRNPLGIIKSSADLVRSRGKLSNEENRLLGYVSDEVQRIERLVRAFLEFARPQPPILMPVKLSELAGRLHDGLAPDLANRKIELQLTDSAPDAEVEADHDQIHQAVLNLALNAVDAQPDGGRVEIAIERHGAEIWLTVADDGPGVPETIAGRLFNPFFTTKAKGTGLGLARVQSVMEAHHGRAELVPGRAKGAAFRLIFPERTRNLST